MKYRSYTLIKKLAQSHPLKDIINKKKYHQQNQNKRQFISGMLPLISSSSLEHCYSTHKGNDVDDNNDNIVFWYSNSFIKNRYAGHTCNNH